MKRLALSGKTSFCLTFTKLPSPPFPFPVPPAIPHTNSGAFNNRVMNCSEFWNVVLPLSSTAQPTCSDLTVSPRNSVCVTLFTQGNTRRVQAPFYVFLAKRILKSFLTVKQLNSEADALLHFKNNFEHFGLFGYKNTLS